jgi:hypothetical protein
VAASAKNLIWPKDVPTPYALFKFDEGRGLELNNYVCTQAGTTDAAGCGKDFFLKSNKGMVYVQNDHQPGYNPDTKDCGNVACHPGANWLEDDHFGTVLSCGNGATLHKDAIRLPDLHYGSTGKWAFNFWLKHNEGHENYDSEYILSHGAANEPTSSRDHIFMFQRGTGVSGGRRRREGVADDGMLPWLRLNVFDGNDPPRCDEGLEGRRRRRGAKKNEMECTEDKSLIPADQPHPDNCDGSIKCYSLPREDMYGSGTKCCKTAEEAAKDPTYDNLPKGGSSGGTADTNYTVDCAIDDNKWHMITLTTNKDGPGWRLHIDGVLRASNPDLGPGKSTCESCTHVYGGNPIDPNSTINLCGRDQWTGWHEHRYYLGRIAHFAITSDALSPAEVKSLFDAYQGQFGFTIDPKCTHFRTPEKAKEAWDAKNPPSPEADGALVLTLSFYFMMLQVLAAV